MDPDLRPWPRLADSWWVYALGGLALVLYPIGLVTRVRCGLGYCTGSAAEHLFDLDGLDGLPRLFTTGLFVAVCVLGWVGRRRTERPVRRWWAAVAAIGAALALAKLISAHSVAKASSPTLALAVGLVLTGIVLARLTVTGRRMGIRATRPVVVALGAYAAAALGLDAVTAAVEAAQVHAGALSAAAATFVEELGEALAALFVVVAVRWHLPPRRRATSLVRRSGSSRRRARGAW